MESLALIFELSIVVFVALVDTLTPSTEELEILRLLSATRATSTPLY